LRRQPKKRGSFGLCPQDDEEKGQDDEEKGQDDEKGKRLRMTKEN